MIAFILAQATETSLAGLFFKTLLVSILVIVLALVTLKYLVPFLSRTRKNSKSNIQIIEYQSLGPKRTIYIVEIEDKRLALGVTDQNITKICDLSNE